MNRFQKIKIVVITFLALSIAVGAFYLSKVNAPQEEPEPVLVEPIVLEPVVTQEEPIKEEETIEETIPEEKIEEEPVIILEPVVQEIKEPIVEIDPEIVQEETVEYTYNGEYINLQNMNYNYLEEPGWLIHYEDDNYVSILGIDISEYSGNVDFYKLKNIGIDFVMLRVGWRGSTEGGIYADNYFEAYYDEAVDAGLNIGYYFFSQANSDEEAIEEANFILDKIADKRCDMFVTFDMELPSSDCRIAHMSSAALTSAAIAFAETIESAGLDPMIYTNYDWSRNYYYISELSDIPIWYAQYDGYPNLSFEFVMWQYTDKASLGAIQAKGHTDLNLMLVRK